MQFCVLVKISKHSISLWYQTEAKNYARLAPAEVPLYFYVNGSDFIFGSAAKERFLSNDPDAFGNYFDIVKDPSAHFCIYDNKKPVKQLLYYGLEQCFSNFINTVLYRNDSIESYRPGFPLRFVFCQDIEEQEKTLVESLFSDAGYTNLETVDYNECLLSVLSERKLIARNQSVMFLNGIDGTLYLELFKEVPGELTGFAKLPGQGSDPRVRILAQMIVAYIQTDKPYLTLNKEREIAAVLPIATDLLPDLPSMITGEVALSDDSIHYYNIRKSRLDEQLLYDSNENIICAAINELLVQNNIAASQVCIVLASDEINTTFFAERLSKVYPYVAGMNSSLSNEAMRALFAVASKNKSTAQERKVNIDRPPMLDRIKAPAIPGKAKISLPSISEVKSEPKVRRTSPPVPQSVPVLNMLIGKTGLVTIEIEPIGRVRVEQREYDAKSAVGGLAVGTPVKVTGTEGKKYLLVERNGSPPLPFLKKINQP